jgi:hypothetical protein
MDLETGKGNFSSVKRFHISTFHAEPERTCVVKDVAFVLSQLVQVEELMMPSVVQDMDSRLRLPSSDVQKLYCDYVKQVTPLLQNTKSWPRLRKIEIHAHGLKELIQVAAERGLLLTVSIHHDTDELPWTWIESLQDVTNPIPFQKLTRLTKLELRLYCYDEYGISDNFPIDLPLLKDLSLHAEAGVDERVIASFVRGTIRATVHTLTLIINELGDEVFEYNVNPACFPNVKYLTLDGFYDEPSATFHSMFIGMTKLSSLTFSRCSLIDVFNHTSYLSLGSKD